MRKRHSYYRRAPPVMQRQLRDPLVSRRASLSRVDYECHQRELSECHFTVFASPSAGPCPARSVDGRGRPFYCAWDAFSVLCRKGPFVSDLLQTLVQLLTVLGTLLWELILLLAPWSLLIAWVAWWLGAVNWRRTWNILAEGAWAPVVLLVLLAARVWASLAPAEVKLFGLATLPNYWWQLADIGLLAALTLFCGWLQLVLGWTPPEVAIEPPPPAAGAHAHH
jgi:hypothetical protein